MFSRSLESTLNFSFDQAREKRHEFITVEHMLFSLLDNPEAGEVLVTCGASIDRLRAGLAIFLEETTPRIPGHMDREIQPTLSFQRVLQRAIYQVQSSGREEVNGTHVLLAIFGEKDSQAVYFLNQENVTRIDLVNYLTQGITRYQRPSGDSSPYEPDAPPTGDSLSSDSLHDSSFGQATGVNDEDSSIDLYAINLNERARAGKLDPVIGRDQEIERALQILCRRNKNNPLFIGEAGVGKTAMAEGLAQAIIQGNVPRSLSHCTIYSLDLAAMLAGTKYRGDFEKRFKSVLKSLGKNSGAIVFIDEVHNLVGAGSATGGTMDAANLIKPMLSNGELRCMGATTYEEYRNFIAKDHALLRRFQKVDIEEPTKEQTLEILKGLRDRFERFHGISYSQAALSHAVELSARYLPDRHLPDKAIDVLDEVGAMWQLLPESKRRRTVKPKHIEQVLAKIARVPLEQLSSSDKQILKSLPERLKSVVFGQDGAVGQLCDAIKLSRAGLCNPDKPVGSFLMAGPTGVGKTELTRQLAKELGVELLRFDMSEYMEQHAVSRLIGAPPGYVGYDQGGMLTESVIRHPHSVLLLDEIEKAHPDMYNVLLQVMDYGALTDNNGRKADFRHVIIIMTTNSGAELMERNTMGFSDQDNTEDALTSIKHKFTPEFRNRLDAVVLFKHLEAETISCIVDKNIKQLQQQLEQHKVKLHLSPKAKAWLIEKGYDRHMGARPMERLISEELKKPLADEVLFGALGDKEYHARIGVSNGKLTIKLVETVEAN